MTEPTKTQPEQKGDLINLDAFDASSKEKNTKIVAQIPLGSFVTGEIKKQKSIEWSDLRGGTAPSRQLYHITKTKQVYKPTVMKGKSSVPFSMFKENIYNLPSLRGESVEFDRFQHMGNKSPIEVYVSRSAIHQTWRALFKTLPWFKINKKDIESKTNTALAIIGNVLFILPNIIYSWVSTALELGLRVPGAMCTQPLRGFIIMPKDEFAILKKSDNDNFIKSSGKRVVKSLFWTASVFFVAPVGWIIAQLLFLLGMKERGDKFASPMKKITDGARSVFGTFDFEKNPPDPLWKHSGKKLLNGLSWTASFLLAPIGWLVAMPLLAAGNILSYARFLVDGVSTLLATPFSSKRNESLIYWTSLKAIAKNAVLLSATAVFLALSWGFAAPAVAAITAISGPTVANVLAVTGITTALALGSQLLSLTIKYIASRFSKPKAVSPEAAKENNIHNEKIPKPKDKAIVSPYKKLSDNKVPLMSADYLGNRPIKIKARIINEIDIKGKNVDEVFAEQRSNLISKNISSAVGPTVLSSKTKNAGPEFFPTAKDDTAAASTMVAYELQNNIWVNYKSNVNTTNPSPGYVSRLAAISNEINPAKFLTEGMEDKARHKMKSMLSELRKLGMYINRDNLKGKVEEGRIDKIIRNYDKHMRQKINNIDIPSNNMIIFVEEQVEIMYAKNKSIINIDSGFDASYVEAVMLCARARDMKVNNNSRYKNIDINDNKIKVFKEHLESITANLKNDSP